MKLYLCVLFSSSRREMIHTTRTTRKLNIFLRASHTGERHVEGMTDVMLWKLKLELLLDLFSVWPSPLRPSPQKEFKFLLFLSLEWLESKRSEHLKTLCYEKWIKVFFLSSSSLHSHQQFSSDAVDLLLHDESMWKHTHNVVEFPLASLSVVWVSRWMRMMYVLRRWCVPGASTKAKFLISLGIPSRNREFETNRK